MTAHSDMLHPRLCPALERRLKCFLWLVVVAAFPLSFLRPATADVTGPVCVENGSVISVNGTRSSGRCVGGTVVRLYGVKAPPLDAVCPVPGDERWRCGLAAASALLRAIAGREVDCRGNSKDRDGRMLALCFIGERTVNEFMVEMGWAEADRAVTGMYNDLETQAQSAKRGIWASDYVTRNQR